MKRTLSQHAEDCGIDPDELLRLLRTQNAKVELRKLGPGVFVSDVYSQEDVDKALATIAADYLGIQK